MSKEEMKYEINKALDQFSDKALAELLSFLKELDSKHNNDINSFLSPIKKILREDSELLARLAQ